MTAENGELTDRQALSLTGHGCTSLNKGGCYALSYENDHYVCLRVTNPRHTQIRLESGGHVNESDGEKWCPFGLIPGSEIETRL